MYQPGSWEYTRLERRANARRQLPEDVIQRAEYMEGVSDMSESDARIHQSHIDRTIAQMAEDNVGVDIFRDEPYTRDEREQIRDETQRLTEYYNNPQTVRLLRQQQLDHFDQDEEPMNPEQLRQVEQAEAAAAETNSVNDEVSTDNDLSDSESQSEPEGRVYSRWAPAPAMRRPAARRPVLRDARTGRFVRASY